MTRILTVIFIAATFISCKVKAPTYQDPIPEHDSLKIYTTFINEERVINVWTPPEYEQSNERFSVLYMPDGGIKEDFPHIANTLAKLIEEDKIPPYILVGIENTVRRRDLTGPTEIEYDLKYIPEPGGADNFRKFISLDLFPQIDSLYRTTSEKAIIGESAAGLFVVETFLLHPEMFDYYIAMDPSLWFNEQYLVKNFEDIVLDKNYSDKKIWFACADTKGIAPYTIELDEKMKNAENGFIWQFSNESSEKHNTIFRATKEKAIIWTLKKD